jgi:hypothetical protein
MALYTKKEFAKLCEIETKDLSNYIRRGKVVLTSDEKIDSELLDNVYFLDKRRELLAKKKDELKLPSEEQALNNRTAEKKATAPQSKFDFPTEIAPVSKNYQIDGDIKTQELEKSKIQTDILRAKREKMSGELVPTDLIRNLIGNHSKSITIAFQNAAENFLIKIAKKKGFEIEEKAELRKELIEIINTAVSDSIELSQKMLKSIVAEYSNKKDQGERES